MRALVIGGSGFLGNEIIGQALNAGREVSATYFTRRSGKSRDVSWHRLDLRNRSEVIGLAETLGPDVIINSAFNQHEWASTADGAAHAALAARSTNSRLIHVSSDAIFGGAETPYDETADPDPTTPYGAAKAAAETAVKAITPTAVIARTSLIVGSVGVSSHERHVHALASGRSPGVLFTDDIRCPVHVADLAAAILELASSTRTGIHHLGGAEAASRYDLGVLIARRDRLDPELLRRGLRAESPFPGPMNVRLDSRGTQAHLRTRLRGVHEYLAGAAR